MLTWYHLDTSTTRCYQSGGARGSALMFQQGSVRHPCGVYMTLPWRGDLYTWRPSMTRWPIHVGARHDEVTYARGGPAWRGDLYTWGPGMTRWPIHVGARHDEVTYTRGGPAWRGDLYTWGPGMTRWPIHVGARHDEVTYARGARHDEVTHTANNDMNKHYRRDTIPFCLTLIAAHYLGSRNGPALFPSSQPHTKPILTSPQLTLARGLQTGPAAQPPKGLTSGIPPDFMCCPRWANTARTTGAVYGTDHNRNAWRMRWPLPHVTTLYMSITVTIKRSKV